MKWKIFVFLLALILCFTSCSSSDTDISSFDDYHASAIIGGDNISLSVKDVTSTGLTVICSYTGTKSDKKVMTGSSYWIEAKNGDVWTKVEPLLNDYVWESMAYVIKQNSVFEQKIDWTDLYSFLSPGEYRIVKDILVSTSTTEFDKLYLYAFFSIRGYAD